jgi:hypothetical protein
LRRNLLSSWQLLLLLDWLLNCLFRSLISKYLKPILRDFRFLLFFVVVMLNFPSRHIDYVFNRSNRYSCYI